MGKSKKRIIHKGKNLQISNLTRNDAIKNVVNLLNIGNKEEAHSLITLFGLSAEEVLEFGASYELVKGMESVFKC